MSSIDLPETLTLPASTTLYYSDRKTVLARLGEIDRQPLAYEEIDEAVKHAVVAARDPWATSHRRHPPDESTRPEPQRTSAG